jgi:cysteine synthase B
MTFRTIEDFIGNTPLIRLQRLDADAEKSKNVILAKLEGDNPAGSVKDRPAISMIRRALERGAIKPGDTLIEPPPATPASASPWRRRSRACAWS